MDNITDIVNVTNHPAGILQISLHRPDQLNALSQDVLQRLSHLFEQAKQDSSVKAILLTGEGKGFCAGADIKQLAGLTATQGMTFATYGQHVFRQLETLGKPSLAAIHGFAFGGGCELAMSATLRMAAHKTVFGQPEIKLGVIPGFGGTQRLSRLVGKGRALDLCLTGRRFTAEEALQWGMVTELSAPEELLNRAISLLTELVQLSPIALQSIMTVIDQGYNLSLDDGLALEAAHFGLCCATADKKEGVGAFLEKRTPVFSGE
ncbi:MAG: enoyl-CoA hydratase-related protein [Gammaproteobacteria bacterium]